MANRKYNVDILSKSSIEQLKKQLVNYKDNILQHKVDLIASSLAKLGVQVAQIQIGKYNAIFTGELLTSIHTEYGGSGKGSSIFYVVSDSEHACFVEFGTGLVGKEAPYPYPIPKDIQWEYVVGKQLVANIEKGIYGWFYPDANGEIRFTQGMPARPFMYETSMELYAEAEKIILSIFKS